MKISSLLLKPHASELKREFENINNHLAFESKGEGLRLRSYIEKELREIEKLSVSVASLDQAAEGHVPLNLFEAFKKSKRNLRFAKRTWSRLVSNESRTRKIQEKRTHVATFAA